LIGDIFCNDDSDKIKYYKDKLTLAQERIKQFSALSTIFNNFNNYETMLNEGKDIPKNVVFNLISSDYFDDTYNQDNSLRSAGTCNSIKILEDAINQFFVTNPDPEKDYPEFCNRLTDSDNFTSIQAYSEVIIAYDIAVKIGVQNVHLHYVSPITGKKPDLLLNLDRKNIFLELTALETRKPELKIKEIASETANYMLKKSIKSGYLVSILFDTMIVNKFTNEQGWIIVEDVIAHFKEMIDRLHLDELIGMNGSVRFHDKKIQLIAGKVLFSTIDEAIIYVESEQSENKSVLESIKIDIADLEEILMKIKDFLGEEIIEQKILSLIEPIIKKYCQLKIKDEDTERHNDPITEESIWSLGNVPIRAYSTACLMRLAWHLRTQENVELIKSLAEDSNTYVREAVCGELGYLFDINPRVSITIAKKYCYDNKYVRWYLRGFLRYLLHKDRKEALEMFSTIIDKYGKTTISDQGEDILIDYVVSTVAQVSLMLKETEYIKLFEEIITNSQYSVSLKRLIINALRHERLIKDPALTDKLIHYYLKLFKENSLEVKELVEFLVLYELIQKGISLLPKITLLLDEISIIKYPIPSADNEEAFNYTIVDYIDTFFESFPERGTSYFLKIMELNEFLINSIKNSAIIRILEKIFSSNIEVPIKRQAKKVLNKIDMEKYWQARDLADMVKDL
jgi:3-methyladenine DNA glycosylase AlkC